MTLWKRKSEFATVGEFLKFAREIADAIAAAEATEVSVDANYGRAMIYGGRWISNAETGEVWRLVDPQEPFMGLWEPVLIAGLNPTKLKTPETLEKVQSAPRGRRPASKGTDAV